MAHAVIMESLKGQAGILGAQSLAAAERIRRPAVKTILRIQQSQARKLMLSHPLAVRLRQWAVPLISRAPLFRLMGNRIALGVGEIQVATQYLL